MNSVLKLIRRFFGILVLSLVFGIVLNVGLWIAYISKNQNSILNGEKGPWSRAEMISAELQQEGENYVLSENGLQLLKEAGAWAQLIEMAAERLSGAVQTFRKRFPMHTLTRKWLRRYGDM